MKYAAIDTETTGLDPKTDNIIEVAVIVDDTEHPEVPISSLPKFSSFIHWPVLHWTEFAFNLHHKTGLLAEYKDSEVVTPTEVYDNMLKFLYQNFSGKIVCAGKNFAGFDRPFLNQLGPLNLHHRTIDPGSMFLKAKDMTPPDLKHCMNRVGLPNANISHRALGDAMCVVLLVREFLSTR